METNPVGSANWKLRRKGKGPAPGQYDRDLNAPMHTTGGRMAHGSRWQVNVYIYTQTSVGGFVYVLCVCVCLCDRNALMHMSDGYDYRLL